VERSLMVMSRVSFDVTCGLWLCRLLRVHVPSSESCARFSAHTGSERNEGQLTGMFVAEAAAIGIGE